MIQYVFDKINTQYPNKVVVGIREGIVDDKILLWEVDHNNIAVKDNAYVGSDAIVQVTSTRNTMQELLNLYNYCVNNLHPDNVNVSSCTVTERLITTYKDGNYRIDIRVALTK
jgi:hypothetical protein